ncbi:alanyl-tRNA editing protein [Sporolactobacillus spathodeae]|uniref:Ser-tRNA(Ala) deacylase AlaX n=1 Tax=Sporolactobacillus spathodeae TaxID=1465502 RepID=A0ABS2Q7C0_9BACL|nr:alanyl-tRNA editing protein [Sporolactobacillus spathodeae]MBM7657694.1 Ser-tRNA(Ala) deacylase AlaX [Sporolactobacillus spathodeae]
MAVQKIFWRDPYLQEINAVITSVSGRFVTLDQTIAYAFNGGQESDAGTIGDYPILSATKDGKEIVYELTESQQLQVGDTVIVTIDWPKRYRLMRLHFAAELVLENVYQFFGHPEKIGANINEDKARIDFYWEGSIAQIFPELSNRVNQMIADDRPIISAFSDEVNQRRYWKIDGFAEVPCGGTHIRRTGEIGPIHLKRRNLGKGKERIEIYLQAD